MEVVREYIMHTTDRDGRRRLGEALMSRYPQGLAAAGLELHRRLVEDQPSLALPAPGDCFALDSSSYLYYWYHEGQGILEAGGISLNPSPEFTQACHAFTRQIGELLAGDQRPPSWKPFQLEDPRWRMVQELAQPFSPGEELVNAASRLDRGPAMELLHTLAVQERITLGDRKDNPAISEDDITLLRELGLLESDYVVFCRRSGKQISRVSSYQALEEAGKRGFKCFSCGRPILDEKIEQTLKCTGLGRRLAGVELWAALRVREALLDLDSEGAGILIKNDGSPRACHLFLLHQGRLTMLEVHDQAPDLAGMDWFFRRAAFYNPDRAVMISLGRLDDRSRDFLMQDAPVSLEIIEGLDNLEDGLNRVLEANRRDLCVEMLGRFSSFTSLPLQEWIQTGYFGTSAIAAPPEPVPGQPTPLAMEEVVEDWEKAVVGITTGVVEDALEFVGALIPAGEEGLHPEPVPPPQEAPPPEPLSDEPTEMFMEELPMEFIPPMETLAVSSNEESLDEAARQVREAMATEGLPIPIDMIDAVVSRVAELPGLSAGLADQEGLALVDYFQPRAEAGRIAGLSWSVHEVVARAFDEAGLGPVESVILEGASNRYRLYGCHKSVFAVFEDQADLEGVEAGISALPGETVLREAILKKVLETLSDVEGIQGNLVAGRDGLIIDSQYKRPGAVQEILGAVASQVIMELERFLTLLRMHSDYQLIVRAGERVCSIIPLDSEGLLLTVADSQVPREVWQGRLRGAATMLASAFQ